MPPDSKRLRLAPDTKIPIQLRQALSTKDARPGDPAYAQTTFPVYADGNIIIPAGIFVQGAVDRVKRRRIKGTAELLFHLTTSIYANSTVNNRLRVSELIIDRRLGEQALGQ